MKVDTWIASTGQDYPGADGDDKHLPIAAVWFRVAYGPRAHFPTVDTVNALAAIYEEQGIAFYAVVVPTREDYNAQLSYAMNVLLQANIRGIQFDAEPYNGYLDSQAGLQEWLDRIYQHVNAPAVGKELVLCYDPREQHLGGWDFSRAARLSTGLAPMVYTGAYGGQGDWGDPRRAIRKAKSYIPDLKRYLPIVQAYQIESADTVTSCIEAWEQGGQPSLFRRGTVPPETWQTLATYQAESEDDMTPEQVRQIVQEELSRQRDEAAEVAKSLTPGTRFVAGGDDEQWLLVENRHGQRFRLHLTSQAVIDGFGFSDRELVTVPLLTLSYIPMGPAIEFPGAFEG